MGNILSGMKNKLRRGTSQPEISDKVTTAPGIFGRSPHPPFDQYPEDSSPITGPTRFAETGMANLPQSSNELRRARTPNSELVDTLRKVTTSTVQTKPNKYRSGRTMPNVRKKL